jgi:glyoxalase family protein
MTTFPYRGWSVPVGTKGAGQITATAFSVPDGSLDFWRTRLKEHGVAFVDDERLSAGTLAFLDPSGLVIEIVGAPDDVRTPWTRPDIAAESAVRGIHSVTLEVRDPARTLALLTGVLGFGIVDEDGPLTRVASGGSAPGHFLDIVRVQDGPAARNGLGTVHHVAMAVRDGDEQIRMRTELIRAGLEVTDVRDRQYFTSIYFREPGGILYEIATLPPGFSVDEDTAHLGCALMLPPWEEPYRAGIEAGLPRISVS